MKYTKVRLGMAAIALAAMSQGASALDSNRCTPDISEVHNAICTDTTNPYECVLHVRGQCLENYNPPDNTRYRVLVADNDGFLEASWYAPTVVGATDLHFRISPATIQCGGTVVTTSLEDRLVKLQQRVLLKWVDVDEKMVTFTVNSSQVCGGG